MVQLYEQRTVRSFVDNDNSRKIEPIRSFQVQSIGFLFSKYKNQIKRFIFSQNLDI